MRVKFYHNSVLVTFCDRKDVGALIAYFLMHPNEKIKIGRLNSNDGMKGRSREHPPQFTPPYFSLWAFLNAGRLQVEDTRTKE